MDERAIFPTLHVPFGKNKHGTLALAFGLASAPFFSFDLSLPFSSPFPLPAPLVPSFGDFALAFGFGFTVEFGKPLESSCLLSFCSAFETFGSAATAAFVYAICLDFG